MLETILLIIITGVIGLVTYLILYARWHYGSLEKLGIPVVKPHFILGSDPDGHKIVYQDRDVERFKKFGPVFGVYEGRVPRVFILDPDMIRRVMVKDFDYFSDRSVPKWGHEVFDNLLDFLPGEKWKTVRSALTPMFTASRIRSAGKQYQELVGKYMKDLDNNLENGRKKFEMKEFMTSVFVEFTSEYFLAIKISGEGNIKENFIYKMVLESVGADMEASIMFLLITVFPFILKFFPVFGQEGIKKFLSTLDQVIKTRKEAKKDTSNGKDFIDVMVTMLDSLDSEDYKRLGISKIVVQAQAFEMFIAGYDSIIGTHSILSYYFAKNPDIQERVLEEIDEHGDKLSDGVDDLPYLTACIKEAIRLNPSFHRLERLCMKEWTYNERGINVTIPKGMSVMIPSWATNRNPDAFKDPEDYRPERYLKGNESEHNVQAQYANTSFGHGPRNCPGSRMGIEIVKAGMAKVMKEFRFEMRDDTEAKVMAGIPVITRHHPIYVDIVKRVEQ